MKLGRGARRSPPDSLAPLAVLDRLEVGPVEIRPRGLAAPYRVIRGTHRSSSRLIYRYEEDVFDPAEPASRNLASMIAVQVALNYGLFARELVFRGDYTAEDRTFIARMAENTAREIYVKKFLEPNPFLTGAARHLPAVKRPKYLRARLVFEGEATLARRVRWARAEPGKHAVLSSGGKESLLTHGLLGEVGVESHPLFVNESGRHWFTALNGYRHLAGSCPQTSRVWTSADRVFNWMLRELPFIRRDFARVRADDYPVRLWTVAVFLFGVLPIVRKRAIGRILIGDEFDTTRHAETHGIPHHDGLFDQSLDFDRALSSYYQSKGWPLVQFSVLRPLSEYLVQKMLAERYPALQREQVSCHATHMKGRRVRPCGRCEKCRRVIGMLMAIGADPGACGYTRTGVSAALRHLGSHADLHQESEGVEHMLARLRERGLIPDDAPAAKRARRHPEIETLRFDPRRSPKDAIPADLAARLYPIYRRHAGSAGGSAESTGAGGAGGAMVPGKNGRGRRGVQNGSSEYLLSRMTWPRARARFRESDTALLPVGAIEQHGPHLPLDLDAWDAEHLAAEVALRVSDPRPIVLPLIPYGVSYEHEDFSGTISVRPESLARVVYDVAMSAARHGVAKLVIVNGHGGNIPALQYAAQMINQDAHIFTCVETGDTSEPDIERLIGARNDIHAGEIETSTALATRPELVSMKLARRSIPRFTSSYLDFGSERSVEWFVRTAKISPSGVLGDPTRASREKGEQIWELMIRHLAAFIETLKDMSLDDIYQRRP